MGWASNGSRVHFLHRAFLSKGPPACKRQKTDDSRIFYSKPHPKPAIQWCDWQGSPTRIVGPRPSPSMVSRGMSLASAKDVIFRDPSSFVPGELHEHLREWEKIAPLGQADDVLSYIRNKVDVWAVFQPYKGKFMGQAYDSPLPPARQFPNSQSCEKFKDFINSTIKERVRTGSVLFWGFVGQVQPPHLVMPITVEPTKPRMCHDERFLNLWIRDLPFSLDYLSDLPRYVSLGHFQTVCDDKSGYDHLLLTPASRTMFGLCWDSCYFVYASLPFGWKASAYVYHSTGLVATSYIRDLGVPCSQYIDDRHNGQLLPRMACNWSDLQKAEAAVYIVTTTLTSLGYTMALSKSSLIPTQCVRYLGYLSNSLLTAFILPDDKKAKFKVLRETILSKREINLQTLQRFAGKTTSFSIAVPAARLYTRTIYRAIALHSKKPLKPIHITAALRDEIVYWRFLDSWQGHLPWFDERHLVITFYTDASNSGWGGVVFLQQKEPITLRDYWSPDNLSKPIVIKEALALLNTLSAASSYLTNSRVDAHTDSLTFVHAWKNQGSKSVDLTSVIKSIFELSLRANIALTLCYVPSQDNLADAPSRVLSVADCMLANPLWVDLETRWGPHSIDLMSLDSNVHNATDGKPLRHFSPWPTPNSAGVNLFAQTLLAEDNAYVFPPLVIIGPVLRFLLASKCRFTIVIPDLFPRRFWWPLVNGRASDQVQLGSKGQPDILFVPTREGTFESKPLEWDLWAFRL